MIQSLSRGIQILDILSQRRSAGVTEIAADLAIHKSSAYRLLATLEALGLVEQDKVTSKYRLGVGVLKFSSSYLGNLDIVRVARPFIEKLVDTTQESAHLCVFSNDKAIIVDQVKSKRAIKVSARIGKEEEIYCSAVGKAILAFLPETIQTDIIEKIELSPLTSKTIKSATDLKDNLKMIVSQGYALDDEEVTPGVRCLAAPIMNHLGEVWQCVGISGPAMRIRADNIEKYARMVRATADEISNKLGYFKAI